MTELETLAANLETATRTLADYRSRLPGVEAAVAEAVAHRKSLNAQKIRGAGIPDKSLRDSGLNIDAAEKALSALKEQIAEAEAFMAEAQHDYDAANLIVNEATLAKAVRHRLTCVDDIMRAGAALGVANRAYLASIEPIYAAMRKVNRIPTQFEIAASQEQGHGASWAVPVEIQLTIVQRDTTVNKDLGQIERSLWLTQAAPDEEADRPYLEAAQAAAAIVNAGQAHDAAGREQAARSTTSIPAWRPTEMHGRHNL